MDSFLTLYLMRHAKSDWSDAALSDFERPLNKRGLEAAPKMAQVLKQQNLAPDAVVSSPAVRARTTAEIVCEINEWKEILRLDARIYEASTQTLIYLLAEFNEARSILLFGHNPAFENLASFLCGETLEMPTAAFVEIKLDIKSWDEIAPSCGVLKQFLKPRELF